MQIKEILKVKGTDVYHIAPDATVYDAVKLMSDLNVGGLLVMRARKMAGIITERDYRNKIILKGRASKETAVEEIMTTEVLCVKDTETVESCLQIMTEKKIRHLPVMNDDNTVGGMISIGDLVKAVINKQKVEISTLKSYIYGDSPL
ncbi:CBS domain-containing protein [Cyclonatronum proteinivorum]|uniref:CBS domain-containing protein n=1 Tax=Cyclonatronum proteinivorum TaxID=1457365 RepID=A0A345UH79_9BACT|nr:CBS domain-containing protein [Cyclonatronum proteinivorum]AXI99830.1 CBS domain-containing protein [Cyclonatronum proteinivorum]